MSDKIKIRVPKGLPVAVANNTPLRKAVGSLLVLKAYFADGNLCNDGISKDQAALYCRVSAKTLGRRIKLLIAEDLLTLTDGHYWFSSWDTIREKFKLDDTKFNWITDTGRDIVDILEQLAMKAPVDSRHNAYRCKLKYITSLKEELAEVTGGHTSAEAVLKTQLHFFFNEGRGYAAQERETLSLIGADFAASTDYYNDLFNYHGKGSMAYKKRKLEKLKLIVCESRMWELEGHTTLQSRETVLGRVLPPSPREGRHKPVLVMPDLIHFLNPNVPLAEACATRQTRAAHA